MTGKTDNTIKFYSHEEAYQYFYDEIQQLRTQLAAQHITVFVLLRFLSELKVLDRDQFHSILIEVARKAGSEVKAQTDDPLPDKLIEELNRQLAFSEAEIVPFPPRTSE